MGALVVGGCASDDQAVQTDDVPVVDAIQIEGMTKSVVDDRGGSPSAFFEPGSPSDAMPERLDDLVIGGLPGEPEIIGHFEGGCSTLWDDSNSPVFAADPPCDGVASDRNTGRSVIVEVTSTDTPERSCKILFYMGFPEAHTHLPRSMSLIPSWFIEVDPFEGDC